MAEATQNDTHSREDHVRKLGELIAEIRIAMLTTMDESGVHRSRPMATQQVEFDGDLWFFTQKSSPKTVEIKDEQNVNVSFADPKHNIYVSVSGSASLVIDPAKAKELWSPAYKAWFPEGLADPNLALLKVHVEQAEYWETPSSPVVQLVGFIKAAATGKQAQVGDHEKIDLKP